MTVKQLEALAEAKAAEHGVSIETARMILRLSITELALQAGLADEAKAYAAKFGYVAK